MPALSASIAPASHFSYASPPSRRLKAITKSPASPLLSRHATRTPQPVFSGSITQPARRRPPKPSPPATPTSSSLSNDTLIVSDIASLSRADSHSHSHSGLSAAALPRFHMADFDDSPSASPSPSPSPSSSDRRHKPAMGTSCKPPSPPLNNTNTFYRPPPAQRLSAQPVPLLHSSPNSLVSRRSLQQSMAVLHAEPGGDAKAVLLTKSGSSIAVILPPSPPPPSPSSSTSAVRLHSHHSSPTVHTSLAANAPPALSKGASMPAHLHTNPPPQLPSAAQPNRTVSSPVVIAIPSASPKLPGPAPLSPSSSALSLLHASHVFVRSSTSLLARWQKRWLMLTQHRAQPYYRLTLYSQPGQSDPLDNLTITTSTTVSGSADKRKQCRLTVCADGKELTIDCLDVAERNTWHLALQQAALLTYHSASALSPTALRALSFPPAPTATGNGSALTSFQQYFFHLYYALPEVGYVHSHYDAAMAKFKERFVDEEAIVRYLLESVQEEARRDKPSEQTDDSGAAIYVNQSAITAYLSVKFETTTLPSLLLTHALASTRSASLPTPHPVPYSHTANTLPPVVIDPINQAQLLTGASLAVPASPSAGPQKQRFEQRLHSAGTLHHLSSLLLLSSPALSAVTFRLLWLLLGNVYPSSLTCSIVQLYLASLTSEARGSSEMIASLRCLLFGQSIAQDAFGLRSNFLRPSVLPCLLSSLACSSFSLRDATLKDLAACLLQQSNNILALASLPHWQTLLLQLLTDVHYDVVKDIGGLDKREASDGEEIESVTAEGESVGRIVWHEDVTTRADYAPQRSVYSYVHNMFAIVHYRAFLTVASSSPLSFTSLLCATLDALFTSAGPRVATQRTAFLLLTTLLNLIDANVAKRCVLQSTSAQSADWRNLSALLSVLRAYTFYCHHWIATDGDYSHAYVGAQQPPAVRMVLYQCKFRHPSFVPFHALLDARPVKLDTVGVHFDEEGAAADLPLVKRALRILQAVRLDAPPEATERFRAASDEDRAYLQSLHQHYTVFEASVDFLAGLQERLQMDDTINIRRLSEAVLAFIEAEEAKAKRDGGRKSHKLAPAAPKKDSPRGSVLDERGSRSNLEVSRTATATTPRGSTPSYSTPVNKRMSVTRGSELGRYSSPASPAGVRRQLHSELAREKSTTLASHVSLPQRTPSDSPRHSAALSTTESAPVHKRASSDSLPDAYSKLSLTATDEQQLTREHSGDAADGQRQGSFVSTEKLDSDEDRSVNEADERSGSKNSWSINGPAGGEADGLQVGPPCTP